ncbi:hypothetical protein EYF80_010862 [Liparis tanakae]|uniref:Uncharacterized protein n=1 Tax=Liparis tanakae TaxID=230148 RepID=A0A4Z2IM04_9TELE|nr:hypothetical protein EYF80_010862 [Liparis tanakae]
MVSEASRALAKQPFGLRRAQHVEKRKEKHKMQRASLHAVDDKGPLLEPELHCHNPGSVCQYNTPLRIFSVYKAGKDRPDPTVTNHHVVVRFEFVKEVLDV